MKWTWIGLCLCSLNLFAGELRVLGDQFEFTEGPAADAAGNIYFTDLKPERIYVYTLAGDIELVKEDSGRANGLYFDIAGNRVACEGGRGRITSTAPDGTVTVLTDSYEGNGFNKPNDLWIDPQGGIYFTDPAYGKTEVKQGGEYVFYLNPDRSNVIRVVDDLSRPNGVIGTPDGKTLYVADPGEKVIWKYEIQPDGTLQDKTRFVDVLCDGMALDELGNLYTTPEAVQVYSPSGELIETIETPNRPTNVTFGGKDNRMLFITARTHVCAIERDVPGARQDR